MSYPTYYISSSVTCVDTSTTAKIIMLPPALNTLEVTPLMICDQTGQASANNIYVSTQINNFIDNYASTIIMATDFQTLSIIPYSTTRYAITKNNISGLVPFLFNIPTTMTFSQIGPQRRWNNLASNADGQLLLAVTTTGGTSDGFYVSYDGGSSWPRFTSKTGVFVSCCISNLYMYVAQQGGYIFRSSNQGQTWEPLTAGSQRTWVSISSDEQGNYLLAITDVLVLLSSDGGTSFTSISFSLPLGATLTDCKLAANVSTYPIAYISSQNTLYAGDQIYVSTDITTSASFTAYGTPNNYVTVTCSSDGTRAFANSDLGYLYISLDSGQTWTVSFTPEPFTNKLECSADGLVLYGISAGGQIYQATDGFSFVAVGTPYIGILQQYGLSADGYKALFAIPNSYLYLGQQVIS